MLTLEAMKMYTTVTAPRTGTVDVLSIEAGENVETGDLLVTLR